MCKVKIKFYFFKKNSTHHDATIIFVFVAVEDLKKQHFAKFRIKSSIICFFFCFSYKNDSFFQKCLVPKKNCDTSGRFVQTNGAYQNFCDFFLWKKKKYLFQKHHLFIVFFKKIDTWKCLKHTNGHHGDKCFRCDVWWLFRERTRYGTETKTHRKTTLQLRRLFLHTK